MSITQEMEKHLCIGLVINCLFVASFIIIPTVPKFICCFANILFFTDFTGKKINHSFRVAIQPMVHFVLFTIYMYIYISQYNAVNFNIILTVKISRNGRHHHMVILLKYFMNIKIFVMTHVTSPP